MTGTEDLTRGSHAGTRLFEPVAGRFGTVSHDWIKAMGGDFPDRIDVTRLHPFHG